MEVKINKFRGELFLTHFNVMSLPPLAQKLQFAFNFVAVKI